MFFSLDEWSRSNGKCWSGAFHVDPWPTANWSFTFLLSLFCTASGSGPPELANLARVVARIFGHHPKSFRKPLRASSILSLELSCHHWRHHRPGFAQKKRPWEVGWTSYTSVPFRQFDRRTSKNHEYGILMDCGVRLFSNTARLLVIKWKESQGCAAQIQPVILSDSSDSPVSHGLMIEKRWEEKPLAHGFNTWNMLLLFYSN